MQNKADRWGRWLHPLFVLLLLIQSLVPAYTGVAVAQTEDEVERLTSNRTYSMLEEMGEVGQVTDLTHLPQTVMLSRTYTSPVVFAMPASSNEAESAVVRITDVQPDRFTLYIQEAPNMDGSHAPETVSYIVLEAGQWQLEQGGFFVEVGTIATNATAGSQVSNQWADVQFSVDFDTIPVILSQVQTNHDPHWVKTRQQNATVDGFQVALEEEEGKADAHGIETIGWFAMQMSRATWNGRAYEAARSATRATDEWWQLPFRRSFNQPRFIGELASYNEGDNAHLRYQSLTGRHVEIRVEEDTTYDPELTHVREEVNFFAIEGDGLLDAYRLNVPTPTPLPTATPTVTSTSTPSDTPTVTPTPTDTSTATAIPTETGTPTPTPTFTETPTYTPIPTYTASATPTATETATETPTNTPTNTGTATFTSSPTLTPIEVPTETPTITPIPTYTPSQTPIPTVTPIPTSTPANLPACAPKLIYPGPSDVVTGTDVNFRWLPCEARSGYLYNLYINGAMAVGPISGGSQAGYDMSALGEGPHTWTVDACSGGACTFSEDEWSFTVVPEDTSGSGSSSSDSTDDGADAGSGSTDTGSGDAGDGTGAGSDSTGGGTDTSSSNTSEPAPTPRVIERVKYYRFNGQVIAMRSSETDSVNDAETQIRYLHTDHLGSVIMTTDLSRNDQDEQQVVHRRYDAYGQLRTDSAVQGLNFGGDALDTDYTYTGQKADGTGLIYYKARYYDPQLGVFVSPDSIVPDPSNVFDWNRYMYVRGNPLNMSDPTGHIAICFQGGTDNAEVKGGSDEGLFSPICQQALNDAGYDENIHGQIFYLHNGTNAIEFAHEQILTVANDEPILIFGYSWGGTAALDLAHRLKHETIVIRPGLEEGGASFIDVDEREPITTDLLYLVDPEEDFRGKIFQWFLSSFLDSFENSNSAHAPTSVPTNVTKAINIYAEDAGALRVDLGFIKFRAYEWSHANGRDYIPGAINVALPGNHYTITAVPYLLAHLTTYIERAIH